MAGVESAKEVEMIDTSPGIFKGMGPGVLVLKFPFEASSYCEDNDLFLSELPVLEVQQA